jgi:hypothetical protein
VKLLFNRFICFILALTIVVGYTGIPVYKMICLEDGHTSISISQAGGECHHQAVKQDCCSPKHIKQKPTESCCANASNFFKLHDITEVSPTQSSTGHVLFPIDLFVSALPVFPVAAETQTTAPYAAPPLLAHKQAVQSIIQVFRI